MIVLEVACTVVIILTVVLLIVRAVARSEVAHRTAEAMRHGDERGLRSTLAIYPHRLSKDQRVQAELWLYEREAINPAKAPTPTMTACPSCTRRHQIETAIR